MPSAIARISLRQERNVPRRYYPRPIEMDSADWFSSTSTRGNKFSLSGCGLIEIQFPSDFLAIRDFRSILSIEMRADVNVLHLIRNTCLNSTKKNLLSRSSVYRTYELFRVFLGIVVIQAEQ